ncbi:MAG: DUF59 domain-containing protein [Phycisphaerales bacterium]|nr:DUF59 domain-containing protein [Phycisphaerales bacterium]
MTHEPPTNEPTPDERDGELRTRIVAALRTVMDPELPVNLYDLGLIYAIEIAPGGVVEVRMTLTTPNCPVAETMPGQVQTKVAAVDGVTAATIDLVWDPPWQREMMSEDAQLQLEMMGIEWTDPGKPRTTGLTVGRTEPKK